MFREDYPDPSNHGLGLLIEREEAELNRIRSEKVEKAVKIVCAMIQGMASTGRWCRSPAKKAAGLAMVTLFGDQEDLRVFLGRTVGADGRFVDLWVARFLCEKTGRPLNDKTIRAMLDDLTGIADAVEPLLMGTIGR